LRSDSCSCSSGRRAVSAPAARAAWRVMRLIAPAYGRRASMRCSARRSLAAATVSRARVIFWMFLTELILFLTSRCEAMVCSAAAPLGGGGGLLALARLVLAALGVAGAGGLVGAAAGHRRGGRVVHRLALLVEVVAEVVGELLECLAHF